MGQMDCFYSYWVTRRDEGFGEQGLAALRDLVPVLGLAIKSAAQVDMARTLGRVYLGRDRPSRCCAADRARRHRAHQRGVVVFGFARLDRDQREHRARTRSSRSSTIMRRPRSTPSMMPAARC